MSDRRLGILLAWLIPLIWMVLGPYNVSDLACWIPYGQYFLTHHAIQRADTFSVLPTLPMVYPSWGISVVYALIYRWLDLVGVCLFHSFVLGILLWIVYRASILAIANPIGRLARYAMYASWLGAAAAFSERPSLIALIPLALAFIEISRIKRLEQLTPAAVLRLCLLNVLWVNIHGSFILLWLMFAWKTGVLTLAELRTPARRIELLRQLAAHACILASTLINPFFASVFPYVLQTVKESESRLISEWSPTSPLAHFPTGILYFALLIALGALIRKRARTPAITDLISSPFFVLVLGGLSAIRNAAIPFVVLLPAMVDAGLFATQSPPSPEQLRPKKSNWAALAFFVALLVLALPPFRPAIARYLPAKRRQVFDDTASFRIAEAIRASGRTCPVFNTWLLGSFLMLKTPNQIFVDSRNIIYSRAEFWNYARAFRARPGWREYLARYHACFAALNPEFDAPLIEALRAEPGWKLVTEENGNLLFEKSP